MVLAGKNVTNYREDITVYCSNTAKKIGIETGFYEKGRR